MFWWLSHLVENVSFSLIIDKFQTYKLNVLRWYKVWNEKYWVNHDNYILLYQEVTQFQNILFAVNVKWGKEKFDGVELNTDEPPMVFKAQLFALTGVQPARQKVMVKGGTLKVGICVFMYCF